MTKSNKPNPMKLGLFVRPVGHHVASWRHPDSHADANVNFKRFVEMAQTAERGCFDMMFSADTQSAWTTSPDGLHRMHYVAWIEPFTQMAALAGFTRNIGLVCTASTTYEEPFALARKFASLDLVSEGRARLESDHLGQRNRGAEFRPHRASAQGRALSAGARVR